MTSHPPGAAAPGRQLAEDTVPSYPMMLSMAGRRAVVVGGGEVALRRAAGLLESGANVVVIAPEVCPALGWRIRRPMILRSTRG